MYAGAGPSLPEPQARLYVLAVKRRLETDFGRAADDYARHRPGFPPAFFDHVSALGVGVAGQRVLDLGTGTGTLARGFAERGCDVVALDPSPEMLAQAAKTSARVRWVEGWAESPGLADGDFDVVCAGQSWHWFDRARAAAEAKRLLRAKGRLLVAYFSYLPLAGGVAEATEAIVLRHHPTWTWAGHDGRHPEFVPELERAGFSRTSTFDFVVSIAFTHEAWRGRIRACNGVLALPPRAAAAFDADLARVLTERFPEPLRIDHRVWGIVAAA